MNDLEGTYDSLQRLSAVGAIAGWHVGDSDSFVVIIEDDARATGVASQVEVVLDIAYAVHVS